MDMIQMNDGLSVAMLVYRRAFFSQELKELFFQTVSVQGEVTENLKWMQ
jgi:hypothetical protein